MTGYRHDLGKVGLCMSQIVKGTMAKVMEAEILDLCLFTSRMKTVLNFIKWFSMSHKHPVGMKSPWQSFQDRLDLGMNGDDSWGVCLCPFCRESNKSFFSNPLQTRAAAGIKEIIHGVSIGELPL